MGAKTGIEWTRGADGSPGATWNPTRGCSMAPGSEVGGCLNCYAARMAARGLPGLNSPTTGEPFALMRESGPRWTGRVELIESALEIPLHWRKPRRIFVDSMSDLFHEDLPLAQKERIFRVMFSAPQHEYQILTKRAALMAEQVPFIMNRIFGPHWTMPPFIHLGVSCENRATLNRIDYLRATPAALRFLSLEPLLEDLGVLNLEGIGWTIIGGESGPAARPMHPDWARSIRDQCAAAGVPFFFKGWGEWTPRFQPKMTSWCDIAPAPDRYCHRMFRVGKKAAGRLLDGHEYSGFPEAVDA